MMVIILSSCSGRKISILKIPFDNEDISGDNRDDIDRYAVNNCDNKDQQDNVDVANIFIIFFITIIIVMKRRIL